MLERNKGIIPPGSNEPCAFIREPFIFDRYTSTTPELICTGTRTCCYFFGEPVGVKVVFADDKG